MITVAQGLMWLIMTGVALFEELQAPIRESAADVLKGRPKAVVEPDTALELMSLLAGEIQHDWSTTGRATELVQLMVESHNDPEGLRSAFRAITSGEPPTALTHALIDSTLRFVVAHEVAHHLLGHTAPLGPERPGPTFLEAETTRIGLSPHPVHLSTAHAEEFSADEMGFILSSADLTSGSPTDLYAKAVITVTGAFIALPALALIDERPPEAVSNSSQSHPALGARGARLGELAIRWCPPNPHRPVLQPTINREIDGHPASAALLSWLVIAVVARRLAELGGTSDAD
ncbi:MAG TPA: hypothetical protein VFF32_04960 [Dermatophilaceae bacterium]|nr:hypothetical protein [Dermatophilaceae bacterium]